MLVNVGSRVDANTFGLGYKEDYHDWLTVQVVIADFAKRFSLPAAVCTAWHHQTNLVGTESLSQLANAHLGKAPRVLLIDIDFTPSIALYIWQSFRKGLWQSVLHYDDVLGVWMAAAEVCSTQGCIVTSIGQNSAYLPAVLAVDPLQTFPVDRLLYRNSNGSQDPFILPAVDPLSRSVLLFAQLLNALAAQRDIIQAWPTGQICRTETPDFPEGCVAIAGKLRQLTDISACVPVLSTNPTSSDEAMTLQPLPAPSKLASMLRSAVLVLKLATLTFNVKADLLGHVDSEMPMAVQALWHNVRHIAAYINEAVQETRSTSASLEGKDEEQTLAALLCEHLVATLRQAVKESEAAIQRDGCLRLLLTTLPVMSPEMLRHEVKRLGILPLAVAFLDQSRQEAHGAFAMLLYLCSEEVDVDRAHSNLVARLQAVRRLSHIFCREVPASKDLGRQAAAGEPRSAAHIATANPIVQQGLKDLNASCSAVEMAISLLGMHPLSPRPPPQAPSQLLNKDCTRTMSTDSNDQQSHTQDEGPSQPEQWPTPKSSEWADVVLVAEKACRALDQALPLRTALPERAHQLILQLCQLLKCLVIGHLPDLDLDLRMLFHEGLKPVLAAQVAGYVEYTDLALAMLSRLAADGNLILGGRAVAGPQIISIFCMESATDTPPSALLTATTMIMHNVVPRFKTASGLEELFTTALSRAWSAFADSLPDKVMLCACLGALHHEMECNNRVCSKIMDLVRHVGLHELILDTLVEVMQVPTPWHESLCFATAIMLNRCCYKALLQSPPLSTRCGDMQALLVQLIAQLSGTTRPIATKDEGMQRLLLTGCCKCLQSVCLQSAAANQSDPIFAINNWLDTLESADPEWTPTWPHPADTTFMLLPCWLRLHREGMLHTLICTVTPYLDSQEKWHAFAEVGGLHCLLSCLCASMKVVASAFLEQSAGEVKEHLNVGMEWYFEVLSQASKHQALQLPCLPGDSGDGMPASASGSQDTQLMEMLHTGWRVAACLSVVLLAFCCREACKLHRKYKANKQEVSKIRLKFSSSADYETADTLGKLQLHLTQLLDDFRSAQKQIERLLPALRSMQQEPAWLPVVADQRPLEWPRSAPPSTHHQDLMYLTSERALGDDTAQAIHSFYAFMLREGGATAAAEQLVAEEAQEAAKAAAKKAKKQKAKARKQQARSDVTPASASPPASTRSQHDLELTTTLHQSSPSPPSVLKSPAVANLHTEQSTAVLHQVADELRMEEKDDQSLPGADTAGAPLQLHAPHDGDEASRPAAAARGLPASRGQGIADTSRGADETFLDHLLCCPMTKVAMMDPVIAADGHTYERAAIQHWLQGSSRSPVTGDKLPHTRLVTNVLARAALAQHAQVS